MAGLGPPASPMASRRADPAGRAVASAVVPVSSRISLVMVKPQCVYLLTRRVGHGVRGRKGYRLL